MSTDRREFIQQAGFALAATGLAATSAAEGAARTSGQHARYPAADFARQGPKEVVRGKHAVASSQHPIVTQTMLDVLKAGGTAMDAVIAGSITQATVQIDMTNHAGTVSCSYWDAKSGSTHYLNSMGTLHPDLPPMRTYPLGVGGVAVGAPMACIPGFMPGMQ